LEEVVNSYGTRRLRSRVLGESRTSEEQKRQSAENAKLHTKNSLGNRNNRTGA
jgi:hypothetical protein